MFRNKLTPRFVEKMDSTKKRTILAVLITFCWTASIALAITGWSDHDSWSYIEAAAFFINGLVFLEVRRNISTPNSH